MKVEIFGTGCAKCKRMEQRVFEALRHLGTTDVTVEKIEDISTIADRGVMMTPALAIDGKLKLVGRVPTVEEIVKMLRD
jgi:small redox-active disulfide protein 2